jgi:hypothetical protein
MRDTGWHTPLVGDETFGSGRDEGSEGLIVTAAILGGIVSLLAFWLI